MFVLGLTSGIGCGKTTAAKSFRKLGARVIDADAIVSGLYRSDLALVKRIAREYGKGILTHGGNISKKKLAHAAFNNPVKLKKLNRIVHPRVIAEIKQRLSTLRHSGAGAGAKPALRSAKPAKATAPALVVIDAPLLIEAGLHRLCTAVAVVTLPRALQLKRLQRATGLSRTECMLRISAQMPMREKVKFATYKIDNSGTPANTRRQVKKLYALLIKQIQDAR